MPASFLPINILAPDTHQGFRQIAIGLELPLRHIIKFYAAELDKVLFRFV
jgi:hypothetical protein